MSKVAIVIEVESDDAVAKALMLVSQLGEHVEFEWTMYPETVYESEELGVRLVKIPIFGWYSERISDGEFLEKLSQEDVDEMVTMAPEETV